MKLFLASMLIASAVSHESIRGRSLQAPPLDCTINGAALLEIPGETLDADFVYDCVNRMGETSRLILDDEQKNDLDAQVKRGAVTLGEDQIELAGAMMSGNAITLPNGKVKVNKSTSKGRKLGTLDKVGLKPILVVRVIDKNGKARPESDDEISSDVFSDAVNLKSQLSACSYGDLTVTNDYSEELGFTSTQLEKISENIGAPGVMNATIDLDITENNRNAIHNAVTSKVQSLLGFTLPGPFDQVMYVVEKCYVSCGYAAYAYINSWMSVYQSVYYKYVGVQVHELGHNFGLAHSGGLNGATYTDHTCMMGNPLYSDNIGKMCYNPAKNWQLPWYGGAGAGAYKKVFDPLVDSQFSFELIGIGEYDNNPSNLPVVVKIETGTANDFFIGFNRAFGPNVENDEADNEVTLVETGNNGQSYSQSSLKAHLTQGESYTFGNFAGSGRDLVITADSINIASAPGTASVSAVLQAACASDSDCADDGIFCNGDEVCINGGCFSNGINPCGGVVAGYICIEDNDTCSQIDGPISVELTTDNYPAEISWNIERKSDAGIVFSSPSYATKNTVYPPSTTTLSSGEYTFTISDSYGDGICCSYGNGSYKLKSNNDLIAEGGDYGTGESKDFTVISGTAPNPTNPPTPIPTNPLTPSPTNPPTLNPTNPPTLNPTNPPTLNPTNPPTPNPTNPPTPNPTNPPTLNPTNPPTPNPTNPPTPNPTNPPTPNPTTPNPTSLPTPNPTSPPVAPPTSPPVTPPTPAPVTPPTPAPVTSCNYVKVNILTDDYPAETSWTIIDQEGNEVASVSGYTEKQTNNIHDVCLESNNVHTFFISDTYGDGICCGAGEGSYQLSLGETAFIEGGVFGSSAGHTFLLSRLGKVLVDHSTCAGEVKGGAGEKCSKNQHCVSNMCLGGGMCE